MILSDVADRCELCGERSLFAGKVREGTGPIAGRTLAVLRCPSCGEFTVWDQRWDAFVTEEWPRIEASLREPEDYRRAWDVLRGSDRRAAEALFRELAGEGRASRPRRQVPIFAIDDLPLARGATASEDVLAWARAVLDYEGFVPAPAAAERLREVLIATIRLGAPECVVPLIVRLPRFEKRVFAWVMQDLYRHVRSDDDCRPLLPFLRALLLIGGEWAERARDAARGWHGPALLQVAGQAGLLEPVTERRVARMSRAACGVPPWPCRDADPTGRRRSRATGPRRGEAGPCWPFPKPIRSWCGPVVTAAGEIALGLNDSVLLFGPELADPLEIPVPGATSLAATADGGLLVVNSSGAVWVAPDRSFRRLRLEDALGGRPPAGAVELAGGDLYVWRETRYARVSASGEVRFAGDLSREGGWPGHGARAIAADGRQVHASALSWSSAADPTEYRGSLVALSTGGERLFVKEVGADNLPTSTGLELRLLALPEGILVAETGAVFFDWNGRELWREKGYSASHFTSPAEETLVYARDGVRLLRLRLPASLDTLLELPRPDWIQDVAADAAGSVYVAAKDAVTALDPQGEVRFRAEVSGVQSLLVGDGYLLGVQQPLALVRVD